MAGSAPITHVKTRYRTPGVTAVSLLFFFFAFLNLWQLIAGSPVILFGIGIGNAAAMALRTGWTILTFSIAVGLRRRWGYARMAALVCLCVTLIYGVLTLVEWTLRTLSPERKQDWYWWLIGGAAGLGVQVAATVYLIGNRALFVAEHPDDK